MAVLSLGVFYGCQKEELLRDSSLFTTSTTDVEKRKPTISIDEAKAWYKQQVQISSTSLDSDSLSILNGIVPVWENAFNDFSANNREFVVAPTNADEVGKRFQTKMLITKNHLGSFEGYNILYYADEEYTQVKMVLG
jgi:hypothetical protein